MVREMYFSDFECFAYDWLFVAKRQRDGETFVVWNDPEAVQEFITLNDPVLCGYNYRDYDSWLLKAVLLGWEPEDIHRVSQTIITEDDRSLVWALFQGQWITVPPIIDLFHDLVGERGQATRMGLKNIEANIGMSIVESSVSFDIDRPLTADEQDEVLLYCLHDVNATERLYDLRYDYVKAKSDLCEMRGVDPLTMLRHTNARVVSEVLGAEKLERLPRERYEIPDNIDLTAIPDDAIAYVLSKNTENCMDNEADALEFMFHGCPTTFALGGIHAAVPKYSETATEDRIILIQDIGSFYPALIIGNGYMSRAVADPSLYRDFYDMRMKAKADGDKATAEAAKLVLNTTYGTFKDQYNKLFDPMQGTRVCLSGQLYILDIIEQLSRAIPSLQVIQLNTDGWVISCDRAELPTVHNVVGDWQRRTGFTVETDEVQKIVQANVNNYVLRYTNGKLKVKGGVVARYAGGDFRSNSATIIDKAVVDYLLDGCLIEDTVNECDDLERFQIIAKAGQTFQKVVHHTLVYHADQSLMEDVETQRVNRVYATTNTNRGGIFKVKMENGVETGRQKIPLTPPHCLIDNKNRQKDLTFLDKEWYIELAHRKAHEFITRDKKERELMAETPEPNNEAQETAPKASPRSRAKKPEEVVPVLTFKQKLLALQKIMGDATVEFDKANSFGSKTSDYADTQQYKRRLAEACNGLGLIIKLSIYPGDIENLTPKKETTPTFGVSVTGIITLTDVDSDAYADYDIAGYGANVSPGYCVGVGETNAIRGWVLNNFMLDNLGREGDDQSMNNVEANAKAYVAAGEKAEIKQGIKDAKAEEAQYTTVLFANALHDKITEAREVKGNATKFSKLLKAHYEADGTPKTGENGKSTLLKTDAVAALNVAEEIVAKGAEKAGDEE